VIHRKDEGILKPKHVRERAQAGMPGGQDFQQPPCLVAHIPDEAAHKGPAFVGVKVMLVEGRSEQLEGIGLRVDAVRGPCHPRPTANAEDAEVRTRLPVSGVKENRTRKLAE
jgi:hypothetical protein